jgi:hypothetical protein
LFDATRRALVIARMMLDGLPLSAPTLALACVDPQSVTREE